MMSGLLNLELFRAGEPAFNVVAGIRRYRQELGTRYKIFENISCNAWVVDLDAVRVLAKRRSIISAVAGKIRQHGSAFISRRRLPAYGCGDIT